MSSRRIQHTVQVVCIEECMLALSGAGPEAMTLAYGGDTLNTAIYPVQLGIADS
jgi:hypothetical protein